MDKRVTIIFGDITRIECDAIVNAANTSLLGGGGVDGAIHRAGGKEILNECMLIRNRQGGCRVGEAVITTAGKLPVQKVIHTVGPVWNNGKSNEKKLLSSCYRNALTLSRDNNLKTIAFPNISTGIYRFPKDLASEIAIEEVKKFLETDNIIENVIFVSFDKENYDIYLKKLKVRI